MKKKKAMTVGQLRKLIKDVPDKTPILASVSNWDITLVGLDPKHVHYEQISEIRDKHAVIISLSKAQLCRSRESK